MQFNKDQVMEPYIEIDNKNIVKPKALSVKHFEKILNEALLQVTEGKGERRHGAGRSLEDQPWKYISDNVGDGHSIGQAIKKLMELKSHKGTYKNCIDAADATGARSAFGKWKADALGAIVYTVMAIMYNEYELEKK